MESEISKLCIFTSNFCLMCLITVSVTVGSLPALTSHVTVSHVYDLILLQVIQKGAPHGIFIIALNSNCITTID